MMKLNFREWLTQEGYSTQGKIGLYPTIDDAVGQYPPLYATARIPDVITYLDIAYKDGLPGKGGFIKHTARDLVKDTPASHRAKHKVWDHPSSLGQVKITG